MSIYAISDLHLAKSVDKPMDIFGAQWDNYMDRLYENWNQSISGDDLVIIPGDVSWATYLEECCEDFRFLDSLPGKKIILKGNHDYWWTTVTKMNEYVKCRGFDSLVFLNNNSYIIDDIAICGTRGWNSPLDNDFRIEDRKIYNRELKRLEMSLDSIADRKDKTIICAMHYPPVSIDGKATEFMDIMHKYNV
ncbi:MAG: metallophosphoesterase, partial [Opitutales bacterium]|nr:metallophosphoesterase [Opitutales bacterium]